MSPAPKVEPPQDAGRVLLVEDDALLRALIAEAMRDAGLIVVETANADEAQRYLIASGPAELVFSDVEMPGSMNGVQFAQWLRRSRPEIGIIISSGKNAPEAAKLGRFIPKPYNVFEAASIARTMVEASRGAKE